MKHELNTDPHDGVFSVIRMIDNSRKSYARAAIDIRFTDVQDNSEISELLAYLTVMKMRRQELHEQ